MTTRTEEKKIRARQVLQAAMKVAKRRGIDRMQQSEVAHEAGVAHGSIQNYFQSMDKLRDQVVTRALAEFDVQILAQLIAHPKYKRRLSNAHRAEVSTYLLR